MKKYKYYNSKDYKKRYATINRLKVVYNKFDFEIYGFYNITDIKKMYEIICKTLVRVDNYRTFRSVNSLVKQWIFFNKIHKLFAILKIKQSHKYRFHYKINIFQKIWLNIVGLFSVKYWKYFLKYTRYDIYYHMYKGDLLKWMKKKRRKKLSSGLYMT